METRESWIEGHRHSDMTLKIGGMNKDAVDGALMLMGAPRNRQRLDLNLALNLNTKIIFTRLDLHG